MFLLHTITEASNSVKCSSLRCNAMYMEEKRTKPLSFLMQRLRNLLDIQNRVRLILHDPLPNPRSIHAAVCGSACALSVVFMNLLQQLGARYIRAGEFSPSGIDRDTREKRFN